MPAWLVKLAFMLAPPERLIKMTIITIMLVFLCLALLFVGPVMVFKYIPLGNEPQQFQYYSDAARVVEKNTHTEHQSGIEINWQHVMAIDAVLLAQNFDRSNDTRANDMAWRFIREGEKEIDKTCQRYVPTTDEEGHNVIDEAGNIIMIVEDYDCSYFITTYEKKTLDTVLHELVAARLLDSSEIEDVKRYTEIDITQMLEGVNLPPNWRPIINEYAWPIPHIYHVTSTYGLRSDPIQGHISMHKGLDIGAPSGTEVLALKSGKVFYAKERGTAGIAVIVKHDHDIQTRYYHLSETSVMAGDEVRRGEVIGKVGSTGRSTGPHLHLEIHKAASPLDPLSFFQ